MLTLVAPRPSPGRTWLSAFDDFFTFLFNITLMKFYSRFFSLFYDENNFSLIHREMTIRWHVISHGKHWPSGFALVNTAGIDSEDNVLSCNRHGTYAKEAAIEGMARDDFSSGCRRRRKSRLVTLFLQTSRHAYRNFSNNDTMHGIYHQVFRR